MKTRWARHTRITHTRVGYIAEEDQDDQVELLKALKKRRNTLARRQRVNGRLNPGDVTKWKRGLDRLLSLFQKAATRNNVDKIYSTLQRKKR